jgi:hypothetical protein
VKGEQKLFRFLFKEVDQDDVIGKGRKIPDSAPADICGLRVIERRDGMGYVNNVEFRVHLQ